MTGYLKSLTTADSRGPWQATPLIDTLRTYARELEPKTDIIVALAHLGGAEEDRILSEVPEVSVVVGGHEHAGLAEAKQVEKRTAVRLQANGRELGRLDLKVETGCKCVTSAAWKRIPIRAKESPADAEIAKQVAKWEKKVDEVVNVPIGAAKREFAGAELKALIERATAEEMGVDFAFMNRGGVRAPLPAGQLLARHVWVMYPFDNKVVVGRFKGKELPKIITEGRQIDPEREYTLAVNDFTAANQESPSQLATKGLEFPKVGPLQRDLIIDWIRKKKILE
jgi:2',3'-cyclic-nucleotide 2'-phosphodiesterase (5'-nucleotidase family)